MFEAKLLRRTVVVVGSLVGLLSCVSTPSGQAAERGWVDLAPIVRPRIFHFAGVGRDGRIYVAAGKVEQEMDSGSVMVGGTGELALDIYNPTTDRWETGPPAPRKLEVLRRRTSLLRDPDDLTRVMSTRLVERPSKGGSLAWEYPPGASGPDGRLYWFGLRGPIFFDSVEGAWGQGDPIVIDEDNEKNIPPIAKWFRISGSTVADRDGKLYLVGGIGYPTNFGHREHEPHRVLSSLEVYDPTTRHWEERAPMKHARQMPAATFGPDGKLYVFGGFGALGFSRQEEGESAAAYAARSNRERNLARAALRSVEAYDPETDTWEDGASMPAGRQSMGAALGADGRIYVVGGTSQYSNPVPKAEVFIYDPKTDSWSEGPPLNHPRYHHAVVATPDGKIWAIGGTNGTNVRGALPRGEPEGLVRPIEMLETKSASTKGESDTPPATK